MNGNVHHRAWEQPQKIWKPLGTYGLLAAIVATYILQILSLQDLALHNRIFTIDGDWMTRPWSLVTSTLAHSPAGIGHILINGLMLYFFGPTLERILGTRAFVAWFFVAGAVSGILQAELSTAWGSGLPALGASGALFFVFGAMVVLFPNQTLLLYGIVPIKFWIAGVLFAALDILGAFNPNDRVGNFAHLAGALLGIGLGFGLRGNRNFRIGRPGSPRPML